MDIFTFSILTNFVYYCSGHLILSHKKFNDNSNFLTFFTGAMAISFIGLFLNFFIPLSPQTNSLVYIFIITIFFLKNKFNFNKKSLIFLTISTLITFLLLIQSNVNRPDAGLYHLPYISILNDNKIIFGLSNIHFRFSHISIMQYLSAMNNNFLFAQNGTSIPLASIVSFVYLYFFYDIWKVFRNKENLDIGKFFSLFILIYISFKITRYSSFGNDAVAHLSYFYLISYVLKNNLKKINFKWIFLISVFIFVNKPMLGLVFFIPGMIFLIQNKFKLVKVLNAIFSLPTLFLCLWLIKNIIISGCAIFPIKTLCIEQLPWTNIEQVTKSKKEGEAWSKAWPDRIDKSLTMEEFNKNLNWFNAWSKKHLKYILNIIIPFITILLFIVLFLKIKSSNYKVNKDNDLKLRLLLLITTTLIGVFSFFFIFPIYRYGYSYIITLISLFFILIIRNNIQNKKNILIFKYFFVFSIIIMTGKQIQKIIVNNNNNWPNIYTLDVNNKIMTKKIKIEIENNFYYYYVTDGDKLCMYSKSPCTSFLVNKNVKHLKKYSYSFLKVN